MGNKNNKDLKRQWQLGKLGKKPEKLQSPLPDNQIKELLDHLDVSLSGQSCDDTAHITMEWLNKKNLPTQAVLSWLQERGGYCDCEILANALEEWDED